jgi:hypothetical protein
MCKVIKAEIERLKGRKRPKKNWTESKKQTATLNFLFYGATEKSRS